MNQVDDLGCDGDIVCAHKDIVNSSVSLDNHKDNGDELCNESDSDQENIVSNVNGDKASHTENVELNALLEMKQNEI